MKGKVLVAFVGHLPGGGKIRPGVGDVVEVPAGVDWVKAGFVEVVEGEAEKPKRKGVKGAGK